MELSFDQITGIIKNNPSKDVVEFAKAQRKNLSHIVLGEDIDTYFKQSTYFENTEVFQERKDGCLSNKDLFSRVLNKETMVFDARGGSVIFDGLTESQTKTLNEYLSSIRKGYSLRKWIQIVGKKAYEADPMGVVFIEKTVDGKPYHTYKCTESIYDYAFSGTTLEYICFRLTNSQAIDFGVSDSELTTLRADDKSLYYRMVDDKKDYILKYDKEIVTEAVGVKGSLTFNHGFPAVPARIFSDLQYFSNNQCFISQLDNVVELASDYLNDRSVRHLTKKLHAYPKLVVPALQCKTCEGTGLVNAATCPVCKGDGMTIPKSPAHTLKVPIAEASASGFDITKVYTYIKNDIETWNKQDNTISDTENLIFDGFWGTENRKYTSGVKINDTSVQETATKTLSNLQPIYQRLSMTADWSEELEKFITTFIGKTLYKNLKNVIVKYGRDYILESTEELYKRYLEDKTKGSPIFVLNDCLEKYFQSLYQNNPIEQAVALKMMKVEPFIHYSLQQCQTMNLPDDDMKAKTFFSEWYNLQNNNYLFVTEPEKLITSLYDYSKAKELNKPEPIPVKP